MIPSRLQLANAVRFLSMDAVQKANSGHPGAPMGMADIAQVLWCDHLQYNPKNPNWLNRDRFVLSNGHGSMLLYALLHLSGYDLSITEIKNFRQLHSKTAGHPEYGHAPGIETTTGPLGQGIANAVGMAIAQRTLAATFNKPDLDIINHNTYVFLGDGCLMEGLSHEACALAGTLALGKLIAVWDDNNISIDGSISDWMERDVPARFAAYGWHVIRDVDGHNSDEIDQAFCQAKANDKQPTLICTKTTIGFGAVNLAGSHKTHGAPLGETEIAQTRQALDWQSPPFVIPEAIYQAWNHEKQGAQAELAWAEKWQRYQQKYPLEAAELTRRLAGELPISFAETINTFIAEQQAQMPSIASRQASQQTLECLGGVLPELFGGSADLTGSNLTNWSGSVAVNKDNAKGNYLSWGVREFGMAHMMNGMVLYGGFRVYSGTFLMFMEFMRNALRMSAMMNVAAIYVYTHDSIGLGEDGPTHQPIEQLATLRVIPGFETWRACDAVEAAVSWKAALLRRQAPTALVFSRQKLTAMSRTKAQVADIEKGAYTLLDCKGAAALILIATGSEVSLAMAAAKARAHKNIRVVSMPCTQRFDCQDKAYQDSVLTPGVKRIAIEAGVAQGWHKYVGLEGKVISIETFGASAPAPELFELFGFSVENIVATIDAMID